MSANISASPSWKAVSGPAPLPVQPQDPGPDRPYPQRESEDRRCAGVAGCRGEGGPAAAGFRLAQIRGQYRPAGGSGIWARALSQGQLELGELFADLIGHPHEVARFRAARGIQRRRR